jgi:pilus assembly protein CpaB
MAIIPKKFLPFIIAGLAALIAVFLINNYIQQQTEEARKLATTRQKDLVTVIVAKQDIPAGMMIEENMLKEETVYKSMLQPRTATSADRVVDKIAIVPISKGEQILLNKLAIPGQERSLSQMVPRGKRAITIPVDNISSVGGMLKPGDHVDVVGVIPIQGVGPDGKPVTQMSTMPLFQDILVLAVGQEFTTLPVKKGEKETRAISNMITLALSAQEANLITFVQEQGKIRLILRSPEDTQVQPAAPASWDTLFRTVMPQAFPVSPEKAKRKVEIYRGLEKEEKEIE